MSRRFRILKVGVACLLGAPLLLLAGLFVTEGFWILCHHRYDYPPLGFFRGNFDGNVRFSSSGEPADRVPMELQITGGTKTSWQWEMKPLAYSELTLKWFEHEPTPLGGSVRLNLVSLRFENGHTNGLITPDVLLLWLANGDRSVAGDAEAIAAIGEVFDVFRAASRGELSPPRHHGYDFKSVGRHLSGRYYHFRSGFGLSLPGWLWVLAWPVACFAGFRWIQRRFRQPEPST